MLRVSVSLFFAFCLTLVSTLHLAAAPMFADDFGDLRNIAPLCEADYAGATASSLTGQACALTSTNSNTHVRCHIDVATINGFANVSLFIGLGDQRRGGAGSAYVNQPEPLLQPPRQA